MQIVYDNIYAQIFSVFFINRTVVSLNAYSEEGEVLPSLWVRVKELIDFRGNHHVADVRNRVEDVEV